MATKVTPNLISKLSKQFKKGLNFRTTSEEEFQEELLRKFLRAKLSREIREQQMRNAIYGCLKTI